MAAAAILNLLFLSILVTRSTSCSSRRHYCKISLIYVNWRLSYCSVQKFKMAAAAILDFIFIQYFGMCVCRTTNLMHMPNFAQISATMNEL